MKNPHGKRLAVAAASLAMMTSAFPALATGWSSGARVAISQPSACARLIASFGAIEKRLGDRRAEVEALHVRRSDALKDRRDRRQDSSMNLEEGRPERWAAAVRRLRAHAMDDDQKRAVDTFSAAVDEAWKRRRRAIEESNVGFRSDIDKSAEARRVAVMKAADGLQAGVKAAMGNVRAACAPGASSAGVEEKFSAALKDVRAEYLENVQLADDIAEGAGDHVIVRRSEIEEADEAFRMTVKQAHEGLKKSLAIVER